MPEPTIISRAAHVAALEARGFTRTARGWRKESDKPKPVAHKLPKVSTVPVNEPPTMVAARLLLEVDGRTLVLAMPADDRRDTAIAMVGGLLATAATLVAFQSTPAPDAGLLAMLRSDIDHTVARLDKLRLLTTDTK